MSKTRNKAARKWLLTLVIVDIDLTLYKSDDIVVIDIRRKSSKVELFVTEQHPTMGATGQQYLIVTRKHS